MLENVNGLSLDFVIHPGETIKEILEDRNMNQEELAIRTSFSPKHISEVLRGKKGISSKFALSLEYVFNIPASFWINLQGIYDKEILELEKQNNIKNEEIKILDDLKEIINFCESKNIISVESSKPIRVLNMRRFLNLNDLKNIPNLPIQQVAFRGSTKLKLNIYVLYAWQKLCQYYTEKVEIENNFNKEKLISKFTDIKKTMFLEPNEMIQKLKQIFKECGIVFDVVKHFTGAPVQGFIQKNNNKIILCMTIRQSFSDIFWFTLFHEIGHLVNDDFTNQYIDYSFIESEIEDRANDFSKNILIPEAEFNKFKEKNNYDYLSIKEFCDLQNIKPGILIGRIQKDTNDYTFLSQYKERYKWVE